MFASMSPFPMFMSNFKWRKWCQWKFCFNRNPSSEMKQSNRQNRRHLTLVIICSCHWTIKNPHKDKFKGRERSLILIWSLPEQGGLALYNQLIPSTSNGYEDTLDFRAFDYLCTWRNMECMVTMCLLPPLMFISIKVKIVLINFHLDGMKTGFLPPEMKSARKKCPLHTVHELGIKGKNQELPKSLHTLRDFLFPSSSFYEKTWRNPGEVFLLFWFLYYSHICS